MSAGQRPRVELSAAGHVGSEQSYYSDRPAHDRAKALVDEAATERQVIALSEARLETIVQELRTLGASWAVVGAALGTTKAAAYKRFSGRELTR